MRQMIRREIQRAFERMVTGGHRELVAFNVGNEHLNVQENCETVLFRDALVYFSFVQISTLEYSAFPYSSSSS